MIMNIVEQLDLAIKAKETGSTAGGYSVAYKGTTLHKPAYMANDEWVTVLDAMPSNIRKEYENGDGGELTEKDGRPPKMASYGSSSRMIYNLSKHKIDFHYEKQLPTTIGGKANLDGFFSDGNRSVFVEAKCHEPYTAKKNSVSPRYADLYKYLNAHNSGDLHIEMQPSKCGRYMNTDYFVGMEKIERFDIKQMICHLLGIATGILKGTLQQNKIDFLYLLYDPTSLPLPAQVHSEITDIYQKTCRECNLIHFPALFEDILTFLGAHLETQATPCHFNFTLVSQDDYQKML